MFNLKDKVAVITGSSGVLGSSITNSLAQSGVRVVMLTRDEATLKIRVTEFENQGCHVVAMGVDILSKEYLEDVKNKIIELYGRVDILLNIAGGNLPGATIGEDETIFDLEIDDFNEVTKLNLNGTVLPSIVFGEVMAKQKSGVIVNYSSMAVQSVITRVAGYSASKAAMENFTKWMAVEMATKFGDGVRVNAIAPGFFIGNQNRVLLINEDGTYTSRGEAIINNTPMKRFGNPEELNGVIHFLCSDASKFITGVVIPIDGGFSAFSGV